MGYFVKLQRYRCVFLLSGIIILALTTLPATMASTTNDGEGDNINPGVYSTNSAPYGISYQEWTQRLWQWDLSLPVAQHPGHDYTPEKCANGQNGPVWFLDEVLSGTEQRTCTIPAGKSILAPVLQGECDSGETNLLNDEAIRQCATEGNDYGVIGATVDGREIQNLDQYRIDSGFYNVTIATDNIFEAEPGTYRAFTNGFFVFLEPLQPGTHDLRLTVSVTNPVKPEYNYAADWTYHLIVEGNQSIPLQGTSSNRDFRAEINWISADIGSENTFSLKLKDANGQELPNATYDVMLFKGDQHLDETHREGQSGAQQSYIFNEVGSYTLRIENINGSGESDGISIPIQVTPEFPPQLVVTLAVSMGAMIGYNYFRSRKP